MKALSRTWEKFFGAISYAEAGEFETARGIMRLSERVHGCKEESPSRYTVGTGRK